MNIDENIIKLWIVHRRNDVTHIATIVGSRMVNITSLPTLSSGYEWVDIEPPKWGAVKPAWNYNLKSWVFPRSIIILNSYNQIKSIQLVFDISEAQCLPEDIIIDADPITISAENELGVVTPAAEGDILDPATLVLKKPPVTLPSLPISLVMRVLQDINLLESFNNFAISQGYSLADINGLQRISISSQFFRDWIASEGITMIDAYNKIHRAVEIELAISAEIKRELTQ